MNILDAVSIRLPCNACGQTYDVPLRDVLLSHTVVRCGCPVTQETECPPVFQVRLFDREPIEALSSAWERNLRAGLMPMAVTSLFRPPNLNRQRMTSRLLQENN